MLVIGIDCATDEASVGVSLADYDGMRATIRRVQTCSREQPVVEIVTGWLRHASETAILAIDAPLGWPEPMGRVLLGHRAGGGLNVEPNELFRRETDRTIQRELAKTPLDVGADRIARTAYSALALLAELRTRLRTPIPLAWRSTFSGVAAVEVYPAATLIAHGFRSSGYKKPAQVAERRGIVVSVATEIEVGVHRTLLENNADALDAAVCVLAAKDFLQGRAMAPTDLALAQQEGWIWAARRRET